MSHLTIRPFNPIDQEYKAIVAIHNAVWFDDLSYVEAYKFQDRKRDPKHLFQRLVVELNGRIVAYGIYCETWWSPRPGKFYTNLLVHPDYQCQGIGEFFYREVFSILQQQPTFNMLTASTREDKKNAVNFLTRRGFEQVMRFPISELDVPAFDPNTVNTNIKQLNGTHIQLKTIAELREQDPDWLRKTWELECAIDKDVPSPEPLKSEPFEQFVKMVEHPGFFPEAFVVAVDNGRYVGLSALWKSKPEPKKLYTGLTGVLRSHRRHKLATAMKTKNIKLAQSLGIKTIETDNEENNPMYQLNLQLGFKPKPAYLDFHKKINQP